jgi:hypothetical protein
MRSKVLTVSLLASVGSVAGLALEKRIDHSGIATVNPNPSGADGSCDDPFLDGQMKVALSNYWMKVFLHTQHKYLGTSLTGPGRTNTRARTADERSS